MHNVQFMSVYIYICIVDCTNEAVLQAVAESSTAGIFANMHLLVGWIASKCGLSLHGESRNKQMQLIDFHPQIETQWILCQLKIEEVDASSL